ncbi:hypothetical protein E4656_15465 [Natronospirillum operosum]|uniref:PABS domain-containing protein n=1 Tax=Natronospirillum operosum TaxID=2759953 RepID=A0A4Z0WBD5_9GAMM|nr:fused MFS/spermidine synthase [Natronospirillum operosum]TGG91780.1 hypothetical protein E4656_15465 [Natronospirillum operosum]
MPARPLSMLPRQTLLLGLLFFVSGAAALIYQVVWVRELGLLFGATAQAAALAIAIFFAGIAAGGWFFARLARRTRAPLRWFGLLELGVAVTALGHFVVVDAYFQIYPVLYEWVGAQPILETLLKALVAATLLFPTAFLMGGTLPMMGQHLIRSRDSLGTGGSGLYAVNTAGGASGALAAGFLLPLVFGFNGTYLLAVGLDSTVGLLALLLARGQSLPVDHAAKPEPVRASRFPLSVRAVALLSGFVTLAVEIIWTRLFSQVLQNSVYTYALVLTTFLAALALGSLLANGLNRQRLLAPQAVLIGLLLVSALILIFMPAAFMALTNGLGYLGQDRDFAGYVLEVARVAALSMLLPGMILGAVLPYQLRLLQSHSSTPGEALGRLIAWNTVGAIVGSLMAGFVILPLLGAWRGLWWLAAVYLLLALGLWWAQPRWGQITARLAGAAGALALLVLTPGFGSIHLQESRGDQLLALHEGSSAHVAVVERNGSRSIRVNNYYTLGSSGALIPERNQTLIPLLQHPDPQSLFFLGMGTGISAGASLYTDPERVTVCEILPDVVRVAKEHFQPWTNGLFSDERVTIHAEDGRHCLARTSETYDAIISDLFTPWKAGTGNLYTRDHYELAARRLNPGGLYAQWIPLYQVSRTELDTIANTMAEVFPQLTVWRGDLFAERSIIALVGHKEPQPLDPQVLINQMRRLNPDPDVSDDQRLTTALHLYAGNIGNGLVASAPVNTDNQPVIEYQAPRTHRAVISGTASWVTGAERDRFYEDLLQHTPPASDPVLAHLTDAQKSLVQAGALLTRYRGQFARSENADAFITRARYREQIPPPLREPATPAEQLPNR